MYNKTTTYLSLALLLLAAEVIIALFVEDRILRPYGGDFLVVILLYCLVRGFSNLSVPTAAGGVLLTAYILETLQYFCFVSRLGLEKSQIACLVLGTRFAWADLIAYALGAVLVVVIENKGKAAVV